MGPNPEIEAAKWNSALIYFIIYICAFPTVKCQKYIFMLKANWYSDHLSADSTVDVWIASFSPLFVPLQALWSIKVRPPDVGTISGEARDDSAK